MARRGLWVVGLLLSLATARPALAKPSSSAALLKQAIHLLSRLEDERAKAMLEKVLRHQPDAATAAQCHLYLGIIALNALNTDRARSEFEKAIATDATVELPITASPKARLVFGEAQGQVAQSAQLPSAPAPASESPSVLVIPKEPEPTPEAAAAPAPTTAVTAQTEPRAANHIAAYVVGGVAVLALGGGIVAGVEANSTLAAAKANPVAAAAESQGQQVGTYGLIADVCYGVSAAAGVAAVVLFFTEKPGSSNETPTAGLAPVPGGAVVTAGGHF